MASDDAIPGTSRLTWIARANVLLGAASLIRLLPELLTLLPQGAHGKYFAVLTLDLVVSALWLKCGLALRKHGRKAIGFAAVAGAIVLTHSLNSAYFIGPALLRDLRRLHSSSADPVVLALSGSRLLMYGIELLVWPFMLMVLVRLAGDDGLEIGQDPWQRRSVSHAVIGSFLVGGVIQVIFFATVFNR